MTLEIGEHELGIDGLDVGHGMDPAFDMGDVAVLETAHDVSDGVDFADAGQKLVAEAFARGGAADQPRDIDEGQPRRHDLLRFRDPGQCLQAFVGDADVADVGLDRGKRDSSPPGLRRSGSGR